MTLFEIGVMKNQILIIHRLFYALKKISSTFTTERRSQVLKLITDLSGIVLENKITSFTTGSYNVYFATLSKELCDKYGIQDFFIYAIGDSISEGTVVIPLLNKLIQRFVMKFPHEDDLGLDDTVKYASFGVDIEDILKDESLTPSDRVKHYLLNQSTS